MDPIPITLSILKLTPSTLLPFPSLPTSIEDVPPTPAPRPSLPSTFALSPTHNYPAPFGSMTLGTCLGVRVQLIANAPASPRPESSAGDIADVDAGDGEARKQGVRGVKMMLELQGPGGRVRLGEVVHGEEPDGDEGPEDQVAEIEEGQGGEDKQNAEGGELVRESGEKMERKKTPILLPGEFVELDVQAEMKELGLQVLICSVAWETSTGRRTFQRFYKFSVVAPLSIKTKIHPSLTPMTQLDPEKRSDVYLEVLMQNTSAESIMFDKVNLEPVFGMTATSITPDTLVAATPSTGDSDPMPDSLGSLHPGDTRQYLFLLHPQPPPSTRSRPSVFSPVYEPGTILPLGRLDMAWLAGPHRERGRLQTSTLNRRVAAPPIIPKIVTPTPTRAAAPPTPGQSVGTPLRHAERVQRVEDEYAEAPVWEFDLAVMELERSAVEVEQEFRARLRVGVRSTKIFAPHEEGAIGVNDGPPPSLRIGVQYLKSPVSPSGPVSIPIIAESAVYSQRDLSAGPSRPMTPISSQLRNATQTHLTTNRTPVDTEPRHPIAPYFPPSPTLLRPAPPPKTQPAAKEVDIFPLGPSLLLPAAKPFELAQEQYSTTYADASEPPERWEAVYEVDMRFLALEEGMAKLGGVRVLILTDEIGLEGEVGGEWETLGDVWVSSRV